MNDLLRWLTGYPGDGISLASSTNRLLQKAEKLVQTKLRALQRSIWPLSWRLIERSYSFLTLISVMFTLFFSYIQMEQGISIAIAPTLNPNDPFATRFLVTNNGPLAIDSVEFSCAEPLPGPEKLVFVSAAEASLDRMDKGAAQIVRCDRPESLAKVTNAQLQGANLYIGVRFKNAIQFRSEVRRFRFLLALSDTGEAIWMQQANTEPGSPSFR